MMTKKELHEFINSINLEETSKYKYLKKLEIKNYNLADRLHQGVTNNIFKCKAEIITSLISINTTPEERVKEINKIYNDLRLDKKTEYKILQKINRKGNNNKYTNQLAIKLNNKLPNLSKNKITELENKIIEYFLKNEKILNNISREQLALKYNVKLKYIDHLFQKLMRLGIIHKKQYRTLDSYYDNARHNTFYSVNIDKLTPYVKNNIKL